MSTSESKTHKAIASLSKGHLSSIQVPTPTPGEDQVLIKVAYAGLAPIDVYNNDLGFLVPEFPLTLGVSASGTVVQVGKGVGDLKVGDRVTAFAFRDSQSKGMQEYTLQTRSVTAKIPDSLSFEEAATIPNNIVTAFNALFGHGHDGLGLPVPSDSYFPSLAPTSPSLANTNTPVLIYGGSTSTGHYAIQLLHLAGYKYIFVTASSKHHENLRPLGATHLFDYKSPTMIQDIENAVFAVSGSRKFEFVLDCITAQSTLSIISQIVNPSSGVVGILLPFKTRNSNIVSGENDRLYLEVPEEINPLPKGTRLASVRSFLFEQNTFLKENLMQKIVPNLLQLGIIQPQRVRLLDESAGSSLEDRVAFGLDLLRGDQVSREKIVVKVT